MVAKSALEDTVLMFTDGGLVLGVTSFPENVHLKYRSHKSGDDLDFVFETMAIEPVNGTSSKIYLDFDYKQTVTASIKYTFVESCLEVLAIMPYFVVTLLTLHSVICFIVFYNDFSSFIQEKYFSAIEIQNLVKLQEKFSKILNAI